MSWEHRTPNWCIFHCWVGVSGLVLAKGCQIYRDLLQFLSVPGTFTVHRTVRVPEKKFELVGRSNFHDLLGRVQDWGLYCIFISPNVAVPSNPVRNPASIC